MSSFLSATASQLYGNDAYTIGQDGAQIDILDANGNVIDLGSEIINFEWHENYDQLNPKVISGKPRPRAIPETVAGSFEFLRYTGAIEKLFSVNRGNFFATGQTAVYSIRQTIAPFGVPPTTNIFTGVSMRLVGSGPFARDTEVHIRVEWDGSDYTSS